MLLPTIHGEAIMFSGRLSGYLFSVLRPLSDFSGHTYSSSEWALLKRFCRSLVKSQGGNQTLYWQRRTFQWCGIEFHLFKSSN